MARGGRQAADEAIQRNSHTRLGLLSETSSANTSRFVPVGESAVPTAAQRFVVVGSDRAAVADAHTLDGARDDRPPAALPRRRRTRAVAVLAAVDVAAGVLAAGLAARLIGAGNTGDGAGFEAVLLSVPPLWLALLAWNCGFDVRLPRRGPDTARIFRAALHLAALVAVASYAAQLSVPRSFFLLALPVLVAADLAGRCTARRLMRRRIATGRHLSSVIVVGDTAGISACTAAMTGDTSSGLVVRGACPLDAADIDQGMVAAVGVPWAGPVSALVDSARKWGVDAVIVVPSSRMQPDELRLIAWQLEGTGIELLVSPGLAEVAGHRVRVRSAAWMPLLHVVQPEFRGLRRLLKGTFDRLLALLALLALAPLLAAIALMVRLSSRGPAIFRQTRVGRDGISFRMLKFRSMYVDAEARLAELARANKHAAGPLFKALDDPRVTRIGRVLRRYSLDELPQLFNILAGQMSLVGPRPPLPSEVAQYEPHTYRRLLVKPGLTGLWQISGRSDLNWTESVRLDLRYVENWSPALDLAILWKTAGAVVRGSGAY